MSVPASSFTQRQLRVTFKLAQAGQTFNGSDNTLVLTGLRTIAELTGSVKYFPNLDLEIYGMLQADMNSLSVIRWGPNPTTLGNNLVTLEVYTGTTWTLLFSGTIIEASPEYRAIPAVYFHVQAQAGYFFGLQPTAALSYPKGMNVASAIQNIATTMGLQFQNNGVTATLGGARYVPGTALDQLRAIADASNTDFYIDADNTLVICPGGAGRQNVSPVTLTPQTGLIGYPSIERFGIHIDALFNPQFLLAGQVTVSGSDVPAANGIWIPYSMRHQLEAVQFGGQWMTSMDCLYPPQAPS